MLFGKSKDKFTVKYQIKMQPSGFKLEKKKMPKEKLEELQNDPDVKIIEVK